MLTIEKIIHAQRVLEEAIFKTDVVRTSNFIDGYELYLKAENLQKTGSFKIRGAYYKISRLSDEEHYGNLTIQAIYQGLGYNSPGGFIEAFKKVNGMTPSVYMKLSRQKKSGNPT